MIYVLAAYLPVCVFGGGLLTHGLLKLRREKRHLAQGRRIDALLADHIKYGRTCIEPLVNKRSELSSEQLKDLNHKIDEWVIWGEAISAESSEWKAKQL